MMNADEFKTIRQQLQVSQEYLGSMLGKSRNTVGGYEAGKPIHPLVAEKMRRLAREEGART